MAPSRTSPRHVRSRRGRAAATVLLALAVLVAPAAVVPDARAGMPATELRTEVVPLLPTEAVDAGQDASDAPAASEPEPTATTTSEVIPVADVLLVGATWTGDAEVEVRSGDGTRWSDWIPLHHGDTEHAPDPGSAEAASAVADASEPVFVGGATEVQFRSTGLGEVDATFVEVTGGEGLDWTPESANSAASADAAPLIRTRAEWGADESLRDGRVGYSSTGTVRFSVVHHVGGGYWTDQEIANGCARSDDWIRGIYAYHVQARGWWDIGYNFVVDPCGTVWEGRHGGILEPVIGAHAGGFNDGAVGVLALGTFSGDDPDPVTDAMVAALEDLVGFKLGMDGADPAGTSDEVSGGGSARWPAGTEVTVPVLSAHQVTTATTCPGDVLRARLFTGSGPDARPRPAYVEGVAAHLDDGGTRFDRHNELVKGTYTPAAGDFDGDGLDDILWYGPGSDRDSLWHGTSDGRFRYDRIEVPVTGEPLVGDFDGDGDDDIVFYGRGSQPDALWLATGGGFDQRPLVVSGSYEPIVGDFDDDGHDDIFWYGPGDDRDSLWWGEPEGFAYRPRRVVHGVYEPLVGQFDGVRGDDILWYGPGSQRDAMWVSAPDRTFTGAPMRVKGTYLPTPLHQAGGAGTDILWYGPGSSYDSLWLRRSGSGFRSASIEAGDLGTNPIAGDFDGNGRGDVFFYVPGPGIDTVWLGTG